MTPQAAIERLKELQTIGDTEIAHLEADKVLCQLLIELGYEKIVKEWEVIDKWYA